MKEKEVLGMVVTERDLIVLWVVHKFRFVLGRHIRVLAGFASARVADRRLKLLIDAGYLSRQKYFYGMPYLYSLTHKGRIMLSVNKREDKIRVAQISHDIHVIEAVIFYRDKYNLELSDITSNKELNIIDGFGNRRHHPDFVFIHEGEKYGVEIELTPKDKKRLDKNISDNYESFDYQIWITNNNKAYSLITNYFDTYPNIVLLRLEEVKKYVEDRYN
ncbi:MAG: replication-relaxation family protein [Eubacteriaceae bacterium]|nr:replication-relaxation family protein [Eubacteriaceae bacterium]